MYELHCPNCGWTSTMTPEAEAAAVAEAAKLNATQHVEQCPRCQWVMRVPVSESARRRVGYRFASRSADA